MDQPYLPDNTPRSFKLTVLPILMAASLHAGLLGALWLGQASNTTVAAASQETAPALSASSDGSPEPAATPAAVLSRQAPVPPAPEVTPAQAEAPVPAQPPLAARTAPLAAVKRTASSAQGKTVSAHAAIQRTASEKASRGVPKLAVNDHRHASGKDAKSVAGEKRLHASKSAGKAELLRAQEMRRLSAGSEHGPHKGHRS